MNDAVSDNDDEVGHQRGAGWNNISLKISCTIYNKTFKGECFAVNHQSLICRENFHG